MFKKNIKRLFPLYTTWTSKSSYPGISWLDFSGLNVSCKVLDKRPQDAVNPAAIDRFWMASAEDRYQSGCHRYQFLEAITRIANAKYKHSEQNKSNPNPTVRTSAEAIKKLIENHYYVHGPTDEWDMFRKSVIWTYDVSDILEANETGIRRIFNSFVTPRRKTP